MHYVGGFNAHVVIPLLPWPDLQYSPVRKASVVSALTAP
jgi:hypothetical protein